MSLDTLAVENIGQIKKAEITFGDLTVLVGPQATGKSILLQLLKLLVDPGHVKTELKRYGLDWENDSKKFLDIYFGEGMNGIWKNNSTVEFRGKKITIDDLLRSWRQEDESLFLIPAQRVLTVASREGWPRPFTDYSAGDPFAVREFSEKLRLLMEKEFSNSNVDLFPQSRRLKSEIRDLLQETVFTGLNLKVDKPRAQKRLVLTLGDENLPYMVWSAGQREFIPLLLGLYWLLPSASIQKRQNIDWVVIEELEMGLHPQAISVVLLLVLDLLSRGYKVCLSTHSPHVLDMIWALRIIRENSASQNNVLDLFKVKKTQSMRKLAACILDKTYKVYYFDREKKITHDISKLDPGDELSFEAGWGGLSEFSGLAADIVSRVMSSRKRVTR